MRDETTCTQCGWPLPDRPLVEQEWNERRKRSLQRVFCSQDCSDRYHEERKPVESA